MKRSHAQDRRRPEQHELLRGGRAETTLPIIVFKEFAMSAKVDQFCDTLRDQLNLIEQRLQAVKVNVEGLPEQAEKAVRAKVEQAQANLHAHRERVELTWADLKARAEEQIVETKETVNKWKANRELRKLQARADRAEEYAECAIEFAVAAVNEAEKAIFDAVVARMDADATQTKHECEVTA
jgi:hypothetical protein